jgi:hypothetical protein
MGWANRGSNPGKGFLFSTMSRPVLGPNNHFIQRISGGFTWKEVMRQSRETDHSLPSGPRFKKMSGGIHLLPPYAFTACTGYAELMYLWHFTLSVCGNGKLIKSVTFSEFCILIQQNAKLLCGISSFFHCFLLFCLTKMPYF